MVDEAENAGSAVDTAVSKISDEVINVLLAPIGCSPSLPVTTLDGRF
jgi:hypothetical protein